MEHAGVYGVLRYICVRKPFTTHTEAADAQTADAQTAVAAAATSAERYVRVLPWRA